MKRLIYIIAGMLAVGLLAGGCFQTCEYQVPFEMPTKAEDLLNDWTIDDGDYQQSESVLSATIIGNDTWEIVHFMKSWNDYKAPSGECNLVEAEDEDGDWYFYCEGGAGGGGGTGACAPNIANGFTQMFGQYNKGSNITGVNIFHDDTMCDLTQLDCPPRLQAPAYKRMVYPTQSGFGWQRMDYLNSCDNRPPSPGMLLQTSASYCAASRLEKWGVSSADVLKILSTAKSTDDGLAVTFNSSNTKVTLSQGDLSRDLNLGAQEYSVIIDPKTLKAHIALNLNDPKTEALLASYTNFLKEAQPGSFTVTATYAGVTVTIPNTFGIDEGKKILEGMETYYLPAVRNAGGVEGKGINAGTRDGGKFF